MQTAVNTGRLPSFAGLTGTYDGLNQVSTFNSLTHTYDANE